MTSSSYFARIVGSSIGLGLVALATACVVACSSSNADSEEHATELPRCVPGASAPCACTNGSTGAQTCKADGTFDACSCGPSRSTIDAGERHPSDLVLPGTSFDPVTLVVLDDGTCAPYASVEHVEPFAARDFISLSTDEGETLRAAAIAVEGKWIGAAAGGFTPPTWHLSIAMRLDDSYGGTYASRGSQVDGYEAPSFRDGVDGDCPTLQKWRLYDVRSDGVAGELDIAVTASCDQGRRERLTDLVWNETANRLRFTLTPGEGSVSQPSTYELWRVCPPK